MEILPEIQTERGCCPVESVVAEPCCPQVAGLAEAAELFHALADETRLAILRQLRQQGEVCAHDLQACCTLAQPTVSHHLKVLRQAGLVIWEKRGQWVHYRVNLEKLERLRALLP